MRYIIGWDKLHWADIFCSGCLPPLVLNATNWAWACSEEQRVKLELGLFQLVLKILSQASNNTTVISSQVKITSLCSSSADTRPNNVSLSLSSYIWVEPHILMWDYVRCGSGFVSRWYTEADQKFIKQSMGVYLGHIENLQGNIFISHLIYSWEL